MKSVTMWGLTQPQMDILLALSQEWDCFFKENEKEVPSAPSCKAHKPIQHRDGKPPWCEECGLTDSYEQPHKKYRR